VKGVSRPRVSGIHQPGLVSRGSSPAPMRGLRHSGAEYACQEFCAAAFARSVFSWAAESCTPADSASSRGHQSFVLKSMDLLLCMPIQWKWLGIRVGQAPITAEKKFLSLHRNDCYCGAWQIHAHLMCALSYLPRGKAKRAALAAPFAFSFDLQI